MTIRSKNEMFTFSCKWTTVGEILGLLLNDGFDPKNEGNTTICTPQSDLDVFQMNPIFTMPHDGIGRDCRLHPDQNVEKYHPFYIEKASVYMYILYNSDANSIKCRTYILSLRLKVGNEFHQPATISAILAICKSVAGLRMV